MADQTPASDLEKIDTLIKRSVVCRLGINDGNAPYIVPLSFGYRDHTLYFHSGAGGKKLALLKKNPNVCFEFDRVTQVMEAENPCSWDMKYQSVTGCGRVVFIDDTEEKRKALQVIVSQYADRQMDIPASRARATIVFRVVIDNMHFKQNPA